jgi:hypothetical protein
VSGEPPFVSLAGTETGRLFRALPEVEALVGRPVTVIGGLAVMCRLARSHRATTDLDTATRRSGTERPTLEVLLRHGTAAGPAGVDLRTAAGAVHVDVLEVSDADLATLSDDPNDRLHVLAHAWAAATATPVTVRVAGSPEPLTARVAEPGPLVATKLQAVMNRPTAKAATDLLDIVRLVLDPGSRPAVLAQLGAAEPLLAGDAALHARLWFDERAADTYRRLRAAGIGDVDRDTISLVGGLLDASLRRR